MKKVDAGDRFIPRGEAIRAEFFTYVKKLPLYNRHDGYEINAMLSGRSTVFCEGREFELAAGDTAFMPEGVYHGSLVPGKVRFAAIHVRPTLLFSHPGLLQTFLRPFDPSGAYFRVPGRPALHKAIVDYVRLYEKNRSDMRVLTRGLLDLMGHFGSFTPRGSALTLAEKQRLAPALELMHERFQESLDVEQLARACSLSRAAFYRHFLLAFRRNPKAMLNDIRLQRAMALLAGMDQKVTDAAFDSGFFNLSNFNRMFIRKTGLTPRGYRMKISR